MNPSDPRLTELLDRWLASIELHGKYAALDDASYWQVQQWPPHDRPSRRVIELARLRLLDLRKQVSTRRAAGDTQFVAALELMSFLAPLLGSDGVTRGIPLARAQSQTGPSQTGPTQARPSLADPPASAQPAAAAPTAVPTAAVTPTIAVAPAIEVAPPSQPVPIDARIDARTAATVVSDAIRMLNWGRQWPELAGLIARLADRPPEATVWVILRANRTAIMDRIPLDS